MASNVFSGRKGFLALSNTSSGTAVKFGGMRDWEVTVNNAVIPVVHQDSSAWTEHLTGTRSWTGRIGMVWLSTAATHEQDTLRSMMSSGVRKWFDFRNSTNATASSGAQTFKGYGFLTNWTWNGDIENVQLFNVEIAGDGKITES